MAKKDQHKAGIAGKPRGQQMGTAGAKDQNRKAMADTPALSGRRKSASKFFSDESSQHLQSGASQPKSNHPSTSAVLSGGRKGETGGETAFKTRLKRKRATKTRG